MFPHSCHIIFSYLSANIISSLFSQSFYFSNASPNSIISTSVPLRFPKNKHSTVILLLHFSISSYFILCSSPKCGQSFLSVYSHLIYLFAKSFKTIFLLSYKSFASTTTVWHILQCILNYNHSFMHTLRFALVNAIPMQTHFLPYFSLLFICKVLSFSKSLSPSEFFKNEQILPFSDNI